MYNNIYDDIKKSIKRLLDSSITGYEISKRTGVAESIISDLRNENRKIENLSLKNAELLYSFKNECVIELADKQIDVNPNSKVELIAELDTNYSEFIINRFEGESYVEIQKINEVIITNSNVNNGNKTENEEDADDEPIYQIQYKFTEFYDLPEDELHLYGEFWEPETEEITETIYFSNYEEAKKYLELTNDSLTLEELYRKIRYED